MNYRRTKPRIRAKSEEPRCAWCNGPAGDHAYSHGSTVEMRKAKTGNFFRVHLNDCLLNYTKEFPKDRPAAAWEKGGGSGF